MSGFLRFFAGISAFGGFIGGLIFLMAMENGIGAAVVFCSGVLSAVILASLAEGLDLLTDIRNRTPEIPGVLLSIQAQVPGWRVGSISAPEGGYRAIFQPKDGATTTLTSLFQTRDQAKEAAEEAIRDHISNEGLCH